MYSVIVHHYDGECSNEGEFKYRDVAMWQAIRIAETLDTREWIEVGGFIVRGRQLSGRSILNRIWHRLYHNEPVSAAQTQALFTVSGLLADFDKR
jgi:hypothetical protein